MSNSTDLFLTIKSNFGTHNFGSNGFGSFSSKEMLWDKVEEMQYNLESAGFVHSFQYSDPKTMVVSYTNKELNLRTTFIYGEQKSIHPPIKMSNKNPYCY